MRRIFTASLLIAAGLAGARVSTQSADVFNEHLLQPFTYRNLGPFRMGARVSDIAVPYAPADHLYTFYVSFWSGGVWKTTNNGTTFEPVFDQQDTLSIGDVTIAPSNADVVWVGTGDAFTSRSSYAGDGVYKSTDAGKTWKNMGLKDSQHIARIQIDPKNPDIVYVAAMGHLYSDNPERGVFKTTDGGATWQKSLFVSDRVGVIDLVMDPRDSKVLYAATYDKQRLPWQIVNGGPGTGIWKTTDAGAHWTRLAGGLPSGRIGRIGLDICLSKPDVLYAVIENVNPKPHSGPSTSLGRGTGASTTLGAGRGNNQQSGGNNAEPTVGGEVYRTADAGRTWTKMNADDYNVSPKGPYYFSQIRVDPNNDLDIYVTQDGFRHSIDGGKTWDGPRVFPRMFGDTRTLWIDPQNSKRMIQGSDGGVAISYDGGRTSDAYANIPVGEIYSIGIDNEDPYNIYAGLQDHEQWKGPSEGPLGRTTVWDWVALGNGDGIVTTVDPTDSRWLYTTREYGGHARMDQKNGIMTDIQPRPAPGGAPYRFIWEDPLVISPHDPKTLYAGAQMLLRSTDRGDHWTEISPDLSTNDTAKILPESEGGSPGGIPWFAISQISESPLTKGEIWVGTSDGKVQLTRDDGAHWTDLTPAATKAGVRVDGYVSRVRASSHVKGRAYLSKSGYKFDDFTPYVAVTDDYGATWRSIAGNLPNAPINVIYEDPVNPNLLFVGDDVGVFVSIDRGGHWTKMQNNMPPSVVVHDLLVHPREHDLILGTYGRDFFVTNIGALEEITPAVLDEDAHLFSIKPTVERVQWSFGANDYLFGQRHASTPNEPDGMLIRYYLKAKPAGPVSIVIADAQGKEVARPNATANAGINTVSWNMRAGGGGGRGAGGGGGRGGMDQLAPLGEYTITLTAGGRTLSTKGQIVHTQGWPLGTPSTVIR
jgi:hypothetical protein